MDQPTLQTRLQHLPIPAVRYYPSVGSTNDLAAAWAAEGAPELALVVADEQVHGRGRTGRSWFTPPGSALAFSLVLRPRLEGSPHTAHLTALGALAVCQALRLYYDLPAQIKWPNDVLANGRKLCGVLVESAWQGSQLSHAVLGVGVNVTHRAVPHAQKLNFPATDVTSNYGAAVDRLELLVRILEQLTAWYARLGSAEFLAAWKLHLAFVGQAVQITQPDGSTLSGEIAGLADTGALLLRLAQGELRPVDFGEVQLRPVDSDAE